MVEYALSCEIIETRLFWLKFEANQRERFSIYHADWWESSKCLCWVL